MATLQCEARPQPVPPRRLWFGLTTALVAWLALGFIDLMIVWQVCAYAPEYGVTGAHDAARWASGLIGIFLFAVALSAGITSYRNWRAISSARSFIEAKASDRREYMAVLGVLITVTLGAGIVFLAIPPLIVDYCVRIK